MKKVMQVLNKLIDEGVIGKYAIGGAIGVLFYTEVFATKDLDVFVVPQKTGGEIIHLGSIWEYLKRAGYGMQGQYFMIDGMPVDFVAVYNDLTLEALENAIDKLYDDVKVKVLRPEYLLAIALQTGRKQDLRKVDLLMSQTKLNGDLLKDILIRHDLYKKWRDYNEQ